MARRKVTRGFLVRGRVGRPLRSLKLEHISIRKQTGFELIKIVLLNSCTRVQGWKRNGTVHVGNYHHAQVVTMMS